MDNIKETLAGIKKIHLSIILVTAFCFIFVLSPQKEKNNQALSEIKVLDKIISDKHSYYQFILGYFGYDQFLPPHYEKKIKKLGVQSDITKTPSLDENIRLFLYYLLNKTGDFNKSKILPLTNERNTIINPIKWNVERMAIETPISKESNISDIITWINAENKVGFYKPKWSTAKLTEYSGLYIEHSFSIKIFEFKIEPFYEGQKWFYSFNYRVYLKYEDPILGSIQRSIFLKGVVDSEPSLHNRGKSILSWIKSKNNFQNSISKDGSFQTIGLDFYWKDLKEKSLTKAYSYLSKEANPDVSVSIFGVPFNTRTSTLLIPLFLFTLIVYLYSNLIHLSSIVSGTSVEYKQYPWIGFHNNIYGKAITFLTLLLFPTLMNLLVFFSGYSNLKFEYLIFIVILLSCSFVTSILSLKIINRLSNAVYVENKTEEL